MLLDLLESTADAASGSLRDGADALAPSTSMRRRCCRRNFDAFHSLFYERCVYRTSQCNDAFMDMLQLWENRQVHI